MNNTQLTTAHLMASLFNVNGPAIVKHIQNIYKSGELEKVSSCSIMEQLAAEEVAKSKEDITIIIRLLASIVKTTKNKLGR